MNLVPCSENCRWQSDGMCTLKDLTRPANSAGSECRYFEKTDIQPCGNSAVKMTLNVMPFALVLRKNILDLIISHAAGFHLFNY